MKSFRVLILLTFIITFSCSKDENGTSNLPEQGSIALAFSNGAGFVVENIVATVSKPYGSSNTSTLTITGTAGGSGNLKITLVDNDDSFKAFAEDNRIPVGATSESVYATIEYESDSFNLKGAAGTVIITGYTEASGQKYTELKATFSAAGEGFNTMTSTISSLILACNGC
ncbi:hypothetical protein [Maribacter sp. R77961]|uniref:hypothetical protein n=1 Tax=Maribacter sp. R77961 TaxID=3093871 RepID=UPI0037CB4D31